jgi:outer membrane immunogenic protein
LGRLFLGYQIMRKFVLALAALAALNGSASAADLATRPYAKAPPPPAPVYSWTGCYISGGGGFGLASNSHDQVVTGPPNGGGTAFPVGQPTSLTEATGGKGWLGIVGGGCDYQFAPTILGGNFVIGAFADYTWSNIHGQTTTFAHYFNDGSAEVGVGDLNNDSSWAVGGRIGYVIPSLPQLLTYFSGGYSQAHFQGVSYVNTLPPVIGANTGLNLPSHLYNGWFLGGGTEYGFNWLPGLFLKTEYRYYSYDSATLGTVCSGASAAGPAPSCLTAGPSGFADHYTPHVQSIFTQLVYRFNWGSPLVSKY